ncbi:MAG TPA: CbiX/SirB N-terminal domain-containing protein [Methanocellaceae archaeon]
MTGTVNRATATIDAASADKVSIRHTCKTTIAPYKSLSGFAQKWHTDKLASTLGTRGVIDLETCYLDFCRPTIEDAIVNLKEKSYKKIVFLGGNGFFDRSAHTLIGIPEAMDRQQKRLPEITMEYAYPDISLVIDEQADAVMEKIATADAKGIRIN